jgi:protein-tyrosine phosphatase
MAFRPVRLPEGVPGSLWLSSMPGRWEPWHEFEADAARAGLAFTLCLTEPEEIARNAPAYRAALDAGRMPGRWLNVPVRDFGVPADEADFRAAMEAVVSALGAGEAVLLHCAAGMGRTGTAAACVLKRLGLPASEALQRVRDAGSNPESAAQSGLIDRF